MALGCDGFLGFLSVAEGILPSQNPVQGARRGQENLFCQKDCNDFIGCMICKSGLNGELIKLFLLIRRQSVRHKSAASLPLVLEALPSPVLDGSGGDPKKHADGPQTNALGHPKGDEREDLLPFCFGGQLSSSS